MRLWLIRHAESLHGQKTSGRSTDHGLTPVGEQQAEALAAYLVASRELDGCRHFVTSPLPRAVQTATILGRHLSLPEPGHESALREMGDPAGAELPPEDLQSFLQRVDGTLSAMGERYAGEPVVAITHAGFIMASLRVLFSVPTPSPRARLDPTHASITEWTLRDATWRLERYNWAVPPAGVTRSG